MCQTLPCADLTVAQLCPLLSGCLHFSQSGITWFIGCSYVITWCYMINLELVIHICFTIYPTILLRTKQDFNMCQNIYNKSKLRLDQANWEAWAPHFWTSQRDQNETSAKSHQENPHYLTKHPRTREDNTPLNNYLIHWYPSEESRYDQYFLHKSFK